MGQLISVTRKPTVRPDVVIFELNRSLTGMGHERYRSEADTSRNRVVDQLARLLLAANGVKGVHIYSNVVTVDVASACDTDSLADIIEGLFTYYREGVEVVDPMAPA